ncbi:MAG: porin family protein [Saprospiraceae bacterium]|nr:porin family protein [Saprospiraceae bacterium]
MKKTLLSLLCVAAFTLTGYSQIGFKAGINLANQTLEASGISFEPGSTVGFVLGVNYSASLSEAISLRPGLSFSSKGSEFDFLGTSLKNTFNYLEVPIDVVYNAGNLSVHAGPYLGLLMSASSDGQDIKDEVKSSDFGLNLGLGYNFSQVGVGVQYGLGLANIDDSEDDGTVKNKVLSIYVTYSL